MELLLKTGSEEIDLKGHIDYDTSVPTRLSVVVHLKQYYVCILRRESLFVSAEMRDRSKLYKNSFISIRSHQTQK